MCFDDGRGHVFAHALQVTEKEFILDSTLAKSYNTVIMYGLIIRRMYTNLRHQRYILS